MAEMPELGVLPRSTGTRSGSRWRTLVRIRSLGVILCVMFVFSTVIIVLSRLAQRAIATVFVYCLRHGYKVLGGDTVGDPSG